MTGSPTPVAQDSSAPQASDRELTASGEERPVDVPIDSLGDEEQDDDVPIGEGSGSETADRLNTKGKRKASDDAEEEDSEDEEDGEDGEASASGHAAAAAAGSSSETAAAGAHPWQAVWSPEKNAWYFWNTTSGEVTWTNPLEAAGSSTSAPNPPLPTDAPPLPAGPIPTAAGASALTTARLGPYRPGASGAAPDIDPDLAHLLPPESRGASTSASSTSGAGVLGGQTAQFNARTGRFTAADYRYSVDHLDEYNRMKRMNSQYFDQEAWERERAAEVIRRHQEEAQGVSSKPQITKKDMDRFKKQKMAKRMRNQAWLRD